MKTTKLQLAKGLITTLFLLAVSTAVQAQDFAPIEQSGETAEGTEEAINLQGDKGVEVVQEVQAGKLDDVEVPEKVDVEPPSPADVEANKAKWGLTG